MLTNKELQKEFNEILEIIINLKNKDELFLFLRDLLSEKEIIEFKKRFNTAKMLFDWMPYQKIESKTWMSSTTIARISKFLNWKNKWYKNAIKILKSVYNKHYEGHPPR